MPVASRERPPLCPPPWARESLCRAAGDTLRPGGLALTTRGLALAKLKPGMGILDAGCGLGATVRHLRDLGFLAVGLDAESSQLARGKGGIPLLVADATAPPFAPGSFDAVLCECVLSLLPDPDVALDALGRLLRPGGMLVVSDLCRRSRSTASTSLGPAGSCADGALDLDALPGRLGAAGFELAAMERHDRLLAELAARLILAGERPDAWRGAHCGDGCQAFSRPGYVLFTARYTGHTPPPDGGPS